ncbi:MAG: TRAP transporter substrate-binding protein DctP [Herminiimonas sp.]|nr:TRAP transporter substrate-binding protein DctP [Herminiimonas sp.]
MTSATRRTVLGALATSPLWNLSGAWAQTAATTLKISHQFPGGSLTEGDFRDRLCRMFAAEVEKRTKGSLKFDVYPGSSLMKTNSQFSAMRKGALDLSLVPLSYAGGEVPEVNIGLMPGLVTSYEQGYGWKNAEIGRELNKFLLEKGIVVVSWIWQAGGVASRTKPIVEPEDVKGLKIRGGSREMDLILKAAGAAVVSLPSNEIYAAMQTGAMDAALTSSTSLISFRLEEVSKNLTTGRGKAYWFMFEPLMMSKAIFDKLTKEQQAAIMAVGGEMEAFARKAAQLDDSLVAAVYQRSGAKVVDLSEVTVKKWQAIARASAWKDYGERNETCAKLLKLAEKTL